MAADMTKKDFIKRWGKSASNGGAIEQFETDVERLVRTTVRVSASAIVNGLLEGLKQKPVYQKSFQKLVEQIAPSVDEALKKLYE